eukprot:CAMPEP_0171057412 /NCGR_PEP_ID=MMETSP0766_2-20121228/1782_1 /TAXON_ID=439317 /ORGANISM="Gambierdiscus australes, Strain CAWD 149" /LENGTH=378 /DNA_ID=CAMNT_0011512519 /DNA_START=39 /DNA_END=1176 /DNA_ORIENTATION=+
MASGTWRIIYHKVPFKGRAEFLRLMLEYAGVEYEENCDNLYGPSGICDAFRASGSGEDGLVSGAEQNVAADTAVWPVMFPPILHHMPGGGSEEVYINQVPAIMRYCAAQLGYLPEGAAQTAKADQLMLNANDLMAECNQAFHPTDPKKSYDSQKEAADEASKRFAAGRLLVWLGHFEKVAKRLCPQGDGPLFGKVTYADFMLFHVLDAAEAQFSSEFYHEAWVKADVPTLKLWRNWVAGRPQLKAYLESGRRKEWLGQSMMDQGVRVHLLQRRVGFDPTIVRRMLPYTLLPPAAICDFFEETVEQCQLRSQARKVHVPALSLTMLSLIWFASIMKTSTPLALVQTWQLSPPRTVLLFAQMAVPGKTDNEVEGWVCLFR